MGKRSQKKNSAFFWGLPNRWINILRIALSGQWLDVVVDRLLDGIQLATDQAIERPRLSLIAFAQTTKVVLSHVRASRGRP